MISLAESSPRINIKELSFNDSKPSGRIRPEVDLTHGINWATTALERVPSLPEELKEAISELDVEFYLFSTQTQYSNMQKLGTPEAYLKGDYIQKKTGMKMLLCERAERLRNENRDINSEEAEEIKRTALLCADSLEMARKPKVSGYLRIAGEHPELLVWLAEMITFQESTLSLPDYYSPQFQPHDPSSLPIVRRF
jgi:hypothetical protein